MSPTPAAPARMPAPPADLWHGEAARTYAQLPANFAAFRWTGRLQAVITFAVLHFSRELSSRLAAQPNQFHSFAFLVAIVIAATILVGAVEAGARRLHHMLAYEIIMSIVETTFQTVASMAVNYTLNIVSESMNGQLTEAEALTLTFAAIVFGTSILKSLVSLSHPHVVGDADAHLFPRRWTKAKVPSPNALYQG